MKSWIDKFIEVAWIQWIHNPPIKFKKAICDTLAKLMSPSWRYLLQAVKEMADVLGDQAMAKEYQMLDILAAELLAPSDSDVCTALNWLYSFQHSVESGHNSVEEQAEFESAVLALNRAINPHDSRLPENKYDPEEGDELLFDVGIVVRPTVITDEGIPAYGSIGHESEPVFLCACTGAEQLKSVLLAIGTAPVFKDPALGQLYPGWPELLEDIEVLYHEARYAEGRFKGVPVPDER